MTVHVLPMPELNRKAFAVLARELGLGDTVRFFSQLGLGVGQYRDERRELFADLTIEEYRRAVVQKTAGNP